MQWPGVDTDVNESALLELACQGHRGDPGVGKPSQYTVPPVGYAGAVEGPDGTHIHTTQCTQGVYRKRWQLAAEE